MRNRNGQGDAGMEFRGYPQAPGCKRLLLPAAPKYGARGVQDIAPPAASLILSIEQPDLEKHAATR
jgi:hypothetical protein